jgi:hypothetical protein
MELQSISRKSLQLLSIVQYNRIDYIICHIYLSVINHARNNSNNIMEYQLPMNSNNIDDYHGHSMKQSKIDDYYIKNMMEILTRLKNIFPHCKISYIRKEYNYEYIVIDWS